MPKPDREVRMHVLVVSEIPADLARASTALALIPSVEVSQARSANEARERVMGGRVDVLVIDGTLRPKGGFSVLYELHADAELRAVSLPPSVVLLTRADDRWLASWARADATLLKPVDPFELARVVERLGGAAGPSSVRAEAAAET